MVARRAARYLAPMALVATIAATYLIVHNGLGTGTSAVHHTTAGRGRVHAVAAQRGSASSSPSASTSQAKYYTVRPGDTLSGISVKTGIPVQTLEALNPKVNPGALQSGQRLRLR